MWTTRARVAVLACIAVLVAGTLALVVVRPTAAAMGNSGIPVECHSPGYDPIGAAADIFLQCVASDGTAFDSGERVPTGHYLLVTDIVLSYQENGMPETLILFYDGYNLMDWEERVFLRYTSVDTQQFHYTTPYLVLPAGHRIEVVTMPTSRDVYVHVSGMLVTNLEYLPLVSR